ncbi:MAG: hydroxyacylglutathione hydrolase C-terminal domain-containing protein, partial [Pseudomonadota bacterium]
KFKALPEDTVVYSGHEYSAANAAFAVTIESGNAALKARADDIAAKRAAHEPTIPTALALELETNPFLRADAPSVKAAVGMPDATDAEVFTEVRRRKDNF